MDETHAASYTLLLYCVCSHNALPSSGATPLHLQPGVVHRRRHRGAYGGCTDVTDDVKGLAQGVVHPEHLITVLGLLRRLLHQCVLVTT